MDGSIFNLELRTWLIQITNKWNKGLHKIHFLPNGKPYLVTLQSYNLMKNAFCSNLQSIHWVAGIRRMYSYEMGLFFEFQVNLLSGQHSENVRLVAVVVSRPENENAPTPNHNMEANHAMEPPLRLPSAVSISLPAWFSFETSVKLAETKSTFLVQTGKFMKQLARKISEKKQDEYSQVVAFIRRRIRFDILRSCVISLRGERASFTAQKVTNLDFSLRRTSDDEHWTSIFDKLKKMKLFL